MKNRFIYKTLNLITNDFYVGYHFGDINDSYLGSGLILNRAIKKYGKENFKREILEIVTDENWQEREKFWIKETDAINKGYNITDGGNGGNTITNHPDKALILEKISKKLKGRISEKRGASNIKIKGRISPMKGKRHNIDTINIMKIKHGGENNPFLEKNIRNHI